MSTKGAVTMWTRFDVRWDFVTDLCASVPGKSNLIEGWLKSRMPKSKPPEARPIDEIAAEVAETILAGEDEERETTTLVFQRIDGVLSVRMATIRAHLKDCAYQISTYYTGKLQGEKSFSVRVKNNLYWPPEKPFIPILRDGQPITEPTGVREKAVHFQTRMGPRSALKAFEYVEGASLNFSLLVLTQPNGTHVVSEADLKTMFTYGGVHGYAGERSEDGGRYVFELTKQEA